jgi:hypothetical protein
MAEAEIHFILVNGDRPRLTIPEGKDADEALRNLLHDPGEWIATDDETNIRKESIVSVTLVRDPAGPLASWS